MKNKALFLLKLSFIAVIGFSCGDEHDNDALMIETQAHARRACECEDKACADLSAQAIRILKRPSHLTEAEQAKLKEIDIKVDKCVQSLVTTGVVREYEVLANLVCACKDYACAETGTARIAGLKKKPVSSNDDRDRISTFIKKMFQCKKALITNDVVRQKMNDDKIVKAFTSASNKICACEDPVCAKKEADQLQSLKGLRDPSPQAKPQIEALMATIAKCIAEASDAANK